MVRHEINIVGMHCNACEKTITRLLSKEGIVVHEISYQNGKATIDGEYDEKTLSTLLHKKGYRLAKEQKNAAEYTFEKKLLTNSFLILCILVIAQTLLLFGVYTRLPGYKPLHIQLYFYLPIAIVFNIALLWHQHAYRRSVSCMTGMMIGMTAGMMSGFTIGAITGLSNGMFFGSVIGTIIGIVAGIVAGRCCGTMGIMEGMMAGLMSGTMGAMLTVMMINDRALLFMPLLFIICAAIIGGGIKIIYEEHKGSNCEIKPWPFIGVLATSFSIMLLLSIAVLALPKGYF